MQSPSLLTPGKKRRGSSFKKDNQGTLRLRPVPQALQKHGASLRRQTAKRFIQYQYPGLHGKRAGNDYPLGFSAGESGRVAMT